MGIHTAPKEDLSASSAELVYGAPLTVRGEFIGTPQEPCCTRSHLQQLRDRVKTLAPVPAQMHGSQSHCVPRDILKSTFLLKVVKFYFYLWGCFNVGPVFSGQW